jgi:hypothetical protein
MGVGNLQMANGVGKYILLTFSSAVTFHISCNRLFADVISSLYVLFDKFFTVMQKLLKSRLFHQR